MINNSDYEFAAMRKIKNTLVKKSRRAIRKLVMGTMAFLLVFEGIMFAFPEIAHAAVNCADTGTTGVPQTECEALMAFYNSTGGSGWTTKTNWDTATAISTWYKVTVSGGHVTKLEFPGGNNMIGSLPTELSNLTYLRTLTIASNMGITGSLPSSLGNVTTLTSLNIYSTGISGTIPESYANLTGLLNFYVNNNSLSGTIPEIFSGMTSLQYVLLEGNQFTGTIPANWPASLDWLWIYSNNLTGPVPSSLASIPLVQLKIEDNKLVFSDFENEFPTYSGYSVFTYSTQKNVDTVRTVTVDDGATATITPSVAANANDSYQWYKDGSPISGATSRVFTKTVSASDAGVYTYRITNSVVTGLTLQSNNITLGINPNPPTSDSIYYITDATGANIYVRGAISATKDMAQKYTADVAGTGNGNFNFGAAYIINSSTPNLISSYTSGTLMNGGGDDAAPVLTLNAGYVMENHGLYVPVIEVPEDHGKTSSDIGSTWSDGVRQWVLAEIDDIYFTFYPVPYANGPTWAVASTISGGSLTWVSGGINHGAITVVAQDHTQKYPLVKNVVRHVLADGTDEVGVNSGGYADFLDLTYEYDLIDPSTIDTTNNPFEWNGSNDVWMHVKTVYRATGGRTVVHTTYDVMRPMDLRAGYMGFTQTSAISAPSYDHQYYYIPKTQPVEDDNATEYDFKAIQLLDTGPVGGLVFDSTNIDNVNNPPDREIRLFKDTADPNYDIGYVVGYGPYLDSAPENRSCVSYELGCLRIASYKKTYPIVDGGIGIIDDTSYEVYFYRQWIDPDVTGQDKLAYWNNMNGHDLVYIDYHKSVTDDVTELPTSMVGKAIRVVESENVTVTDTVVQSGGVTLSTTGANTYGYAVLELTAQDPVLHSTACPTDGGWCNDATPDLDVTNNASGQHYHYLVNQTAAPDKTAVEAGTEDLDGAFTIPGGSITAEGEWYIHVITQSDNGDFSNNYSTYTIKYDGTAPASGLSASPTAANGANGWYNTAPVISLSATDDLSGVATTRYFWDMDGESTYSSAISAPEGTHTISYYSRDNAENSDSTNTREFKVDTIAPTDFTPTTSPSSWTATNSAIITFSTTDATSGLADYAIKIDDGSYTSGITSPYTLNTANLADGTHTLTVKATDLAGNIREHAASLYIDRTSPTVSSIRPTGTINTGASWVTLSVTTSESATCKYSDTISTAYESMANTLTTTNGTTHSTFITQLKTGVYYSYYIRCSDTTGNISSEYQSRFIILNPVGQPPRLYMPVLFDGPSPGITIAGYGQGGQTIKIYVDGKRVKSIKLKGTTGVKKKFSANISLARYAQGRHSVYTKAYDADGVSSPASSTYRFNIQKSYGRTKILMNTTTKYIVKNGDSLWRIARLYLGYGSYYQKIINLNKSLYSTLKKRPWLLRGGWVLKLPAALI